MLLLEGKFADGDSVKVDAQEGKLGFEKAKAGKAASVA
jgi:hypothetical protein